FRYRRIWVVCLLRLVVFPLVVLAVLKYGGLAALIPEGKSILLITFLATTTPTASTVTQMAQLYGKDANYATSINVLTTLLCVFTMPVMVMLYQA
ncbi:MAG: AEC family transporter, partial [Oscillospiraceae bacterium]|nr:AEC family transporter [Oscillospiraceae bacterium]